MSRPRWVCPAKVNLNLRVLGRRDDGYHQIETAMVAVDWCDRLDVAPAERLSLDCRPSVTERPEENIVWRAAQALAERLGRAALGAALTLHKDIPAGAGLGGGSSDAASALRALSQLWGVTDAKLVADVAAELGSDVPFFLDGRAAICRGRGERVEAVGRSAPLLRLVLAVPPVALSTAAVYRAWRPPRRPAPPLPAEVLARAEARELAPLIANDLEETAAALQPRVAELLATMRELPFLAVALTGSGAGCFGLAEDHAQAEGLARELARRTSARVRAVASVLLGLVLAALPAFAAPAPAADPERQAYVRALDTALERLDQAPPAGEPLARNDWLQAAVAGVLTSLAARRRTYAWTWLEQLLVEHRQGDTQRQALLEAQLRERLAGLGDVARESLAPAPARVYPQPPAVALNKLLLRPQFRHTAAGPEFFPALAEKLKYLFQRFLRAPTERAFLVSRLAMALMVMALSGLLGFLVFRRRARLRRRLASAESAGAARAAAVAPPAGADELELLAHWGRTWAAELERRAGLAHDPARTLGETLTAARARGIDRAGWPALLEDYQRLRYGAARNEQRRTLCVALREACSA